MDTGPAFRLKVGGSLLYLAKRVIRYAVCNSRQVYEETTREVQTYGRANAFQWLVHIWSSRRPANWKYLMTGRISPWMTTLGVRPRLDKSCLTTTEISSTRYKQAMISASILSEQCGRATDRHAITRDRPPSITYMTYPAPPKVSSRIQLPSNWPTICIEGSDGVSSGGIAKINSLGLTD